MSGPARNCLFVALIGLSSGALAQERTPEPAKSEVIPSKDESVIRANVAAFVKAYNAGDAKALAALFVPEAQMIDEEGNTTQGRDAIEKVFAGLLAEKPQPQMAVEIESIRFIGSALAIETGVSKVTHKPGEPPDVDRYTAVHVKTRAGQWMMAFVHDTPGTDLTNYERLKPLEWLVGDWIDEARESVVMTSYKWAPNRNYILGEIKVRMQGRDAMDISQRIGWDPLTKRIKSWQFDTEGGHGESVWTSAGDHWVVKATGVRRDGTPSSATNLITPTSNHSYTWRSTDHVVGTEMVPPTEVKVVRKAPEPAVAK
ncbi:MAG TPA: SgcJ/EcaC family oxidoreductase [Planctomycetaceae bacterium]|nr:SgcJ/EcaC family oxidoreductase [Planctomycetaceae bacterium]